MFCRNERHVSIEGTSRMPCSVPKGPLVVVGQCCISCPHVELHLAKTSSSVPFRPQVRQVKGPVIMFDHTFDVWLSKRYQQDFAHIDEGAAGTNSCLEVSLRWTCAQKPLPKQYTFKEQNGQQKSKCADLNQDTVTSLKHKRMRNHIFFILSWSVRVVKRDDLRSKLFPRSNFVEKDNFEGFPAIMKNRSYASFQ